MRENIKFTLVKESQEDSFYIEKILVEIANKFYENGLIS